MTTPNKEGEEIDWGKAITTNSLEASSPPTKEQWKKAFADAINQPKKPYIPIYSVRDRDFILKMIKDHENTKQ